MPPKAAIDPNEKKYIYMKVVGGEIAPAAALAPRCAPCLKNNPQKLWNLDSSASRIQTAPETLLLTAYRLSIHVKRLGSCTPSQLSAWVSTSC